MAEEIVGREDLGGLGVACPSCQCPQSRVLETRRGKRLIRRRRLCDNGNCRQRIFYTVERVLGDDAKGRKM